MPGQFLKTLDISALTDVGLKRQRNEDSNRYTVPPPGDVQETGGALFVVADGMGGLGGGDVASQTAVAEIFERYYAADNHERNLQTRLLAALESANGLVREQAPRLKLPR